MKADSERSWSIGKHFVFAWERHDWEHGFYYEGSVATPQGIVLVYVEQKHSSLQFVREGRCYYRSFRRLLTRKVAVFEAKKFAREIVELIEKLPF